MTAPQPARTSTLFFHPHARELAESWREVFMLAERAAPPDDQPRHVLWAVDDHLELRGAGLRGGVWIPAAELARRAREGGELLRACGAAAGRSLSVLDAMAGWGLDGLLLAARGCRVTLVERQPLVSALQQDLARRSGLTVTTILGDGYQALADAGTVDVVYLDPMFPRRGKGALPGKRMQVLAALAEADDRPLGAWLEAAAVAARCRVVLKRRRKDPQVVRPDWQIRGRTVRYDVYRGRASA